jgi:putative ABC transport system ATP-binding protein
MTAILSVRGVGKTYEDGRRQRHVLHGMSFDLHAGEVVALCGPSGSGKTTLLNACAGLLTPDEGEIGLTTSAGVQNLAGLSESARTDLRRQHVGYVFQFFNLVPTLTVRENVLLPLLLCRRPDLAARALARLSGLGLDDCAEALPEQLSGGERQRVAIARALAHEPRLVLADEPTGNLDAANATMVVDLLWQHVRALGSGLLVATHDPAVAGRADRIIKVDR